MTINASGVRYDFNQFVNAYGIICRLRYFSFTFSGAVYDDETTIAQSGSSLWLSGIQQPIRDTRGTYENILLQQGKITQKDSVFYLPGNIDLTLSTGSGMIEVGLGSPTPELYTFIETITPWYIGNEVVYKKCFIRKTGSIYSI